MINDLYTKEAVRSRKSIVSRNNFGEPIFSTANSISFKCAFQPDNGSFEIQESGKVTKSTHRVYCSTTVDVVAGDALIIDSTIYRVLVVMNDSGRDHHFKVMLEEVK